MWCDEGVMWPITTDMGDSFCKYKINTSLHMILIHYVLGYVERLPYKSLWVGCYYNRNRHNNRNVWFTFRAAVIES